jgi:hypothetical protein
MMETVSFSKRRRLSASTHGVITQEQRQLYHCENLRYHKTCIYKYLVLKKEPVFFVESLVSTYKHTCKPTPTQHLYRWEHVNYVRRTVLMEKVCFSKRRSLRTGGAHGLITQRPTSTFHRRENLKSHVTYKYFKIRCSLKYLDAVRMKQMNTIWDFRLSLRRVWKWQFSGI